MIAGIRTDTDERGKLVLPPEIEEEIRIEKERREREWWSSCLAASSRDGLCSTSTPSEPPVKEKPMVGLPSDTDPMILLPWGINVVRNSSGKLVEVRLDHNHFILSKNRLRWLRLKSILICILAGGALGWGLPAGLQKTGAWWEQRSERAAAEQEHKESHYYIPWKCENCGTASIQADAGPFRVEAVKGQPAGEVLLGAACPNCAVIGSLSTK